MKPTTFLSEKCVNVALQVWELVPIDQKQSKNMNKYRERKHNELLI